MPWCWEPYNPGKITKHCDDDLSFNNFAVMKIVSLFTKAPAYKRFNYEPRFYNQRAEEMKEREDRIRQELARADGKSITEDTDYRSRLTGAFQHARKRSQGSSASMNSSLIRLGVLLFLTLIIMAFMTWGTVALYSLFLIIPAYGYLKFRK